MKHFLIIALILTGQVYGQNYIDYQRILTRINNDIINNDFSKTVERLDSIYLNYNFIYAKHCIKALQICCHLNDSFNADKWLSKSFKQGIPLWVIKTNEITRKSLLYITTQNTIRKYDSLHTIYTASINPVITMTIDSLLNIDQKYTQKVNDGFFLFRHTIYGLMWLRNNKREFKILDQIIDQYGYPGERIIGLDPYIIDSSKIAKYLVSWGPGIIEESRTYIMLLHYFSNYRKNSNDFLKKLYENLVTGYIATPFFLGINDFIYHQSREKFGTKYYINKNKTDNDTSVIDNSRNLIGLSKLVQSKQMTNIYEERRKNKKRNSEIILE